MKIGFVGLGQMGAPMACNLIRAGHTLIGYDPQPTQIDGMQCANSAADCAAGCDVVITMLPDGQIASDVANQIHPALPDGALHVDCSTIDVTNAHGIHGSAAQHGLLALDAPVSGGISGAQAGTLTFMVGGDDRAFGRGTPLFDIMGQKAVHCGSAGAGQAAKICNNMILGATMIATCEAFVLADALGLERRKMFDVISTSSGQSWSMNTYCPAPGVGPNSPADNEYRPGFSAGLMLKDLRLSQQAATDSGAQTPMGAMACDLYARLVQDYDMGDQDFSAVLTYFEQQTKK